MASEEQAVVLGLFMTADSAEGVTSVTPPKEGGRGHLCYTGSDIYDLGL